MVLGLFSVFQKIYGSSLADTLASATLTARAMDNELTGRIIGCAIEVHKELGPGLLESAYETAFSKELSISGIEHQRQVALPLNYKGERLDCGFRIDLIVANEVIIEIKAVERLLPIHEAQLMTYIRLAKKRIGLLINFNEVQLRDGLRRFVI
jgi:GxxExxY protein